MKEYVYKTLVLPSLDHIIVVQSGTLILKKVNQSLRCYNTRQHRFVANKPWYKHKQNVSITKILTDLQWPPLENRRKQACPIRVGQYTDYLVISQYEYGTDYKF